jgi:hypothetical protein
MTDEVNVDDIYVIIGACFDKGNKKFANIISNLLSEYERLKRLDDNVRKMIEDFENLDDQNYNAWHIININKAVQQILESLYE